MKTLIIIPARMGSTRLPGKALVDIEGKPMIVRVMEQAKKSKIPDIFVACDGDEIAEIVENAGGKAIITDPNLPSGTDRIYKALIQIENYEQYDGILNIQGDLPLIDPKLVNLMGEKLENSQLDIVTPVVKIHQEEERSSDAVVKVATHIDPETKTGRALYFSRNIIPWGEGDLYHHVGLYGYRREILERFVQLPISPLEQREKLEQLRALENGMSIEAVEVDEAPWGVDRMEDLEIVRRFIKENGI